MINFKLIKFEETIPVGQKPNLSLAWFWLTEGDLWINIGNQTIYEYSKEAIDTFENKTSKYNDYFIARFLEDFTEIFEKISESIPLNFYSLTKNIKQFKNDAEKWLNIFDTDDVKHSDFYFDEYDKLISWTYERNLNSCHLIGGPDLFFFRHKDKIRIVWDTEYTLENGIDLWTAKDGNFEMDFSNFVKEVKLFGEKFFYEMDKQIKLTVEKEWLDIKIDKIGLIEEHKERKIEFKKKLSFLEQEKREEKWIELEELYKRMLVEIK